LLSAHHAVPEVIATIIFCQVILVVSVFIILLIFFKILIVSAETPIFLLLDTNNHGIDSKIGNADTSLSYGSHFFLLRGCESSFAFLRVNEESGTSVC